MEMTTEVLADLLDRRMRKYYSRVPYYYRNVTGGRSRHSAARMMEVAEKIKVLSEELSNMPEEADGCASVGSWLAVIIGAEPSSTLPRVPETGDKEKAMDIETKGMTLL